MASFEIVELDATGKTRPFPAGVFPDGKTASAIIAELQVKYPSKKFQPRPIKDETNDWRAREKRRFDEGVYQPLGWDLTPIKDHFAHKAIKTPTNVAFTPEQQSGVIDKQVSIHVRVYLQRHYPDLTIEQRRKLVWDFCGEDIGEKLEFAETADEIRHVYENGPGSCMSDNADEYECDGYHPTEAYAGPDLKVAFIKDGNRITARAIVWPDQKIYGGIYGDGTKLRAALEEAGYHRSCYYSDWYGARLTAIKLGQGRYVCPYLDICSEAKLSDDGKFLILCRYETGASDAQNTNGRIYF